MLLRSISNTATVFCTEDFKEFIQGLFLGWRITKCFDKSISFIFQRFECHHTHYQGTAFRLKFQFLLNCVIHETVTKQSNIIVKQYYCIKKLLKS